MKKQIIIISTLVVLGSASCKKNKKTEPNNPETTTVVENYTSQKQQVKETYANIAFAVYNDTYLGALDLKVLINNFVSNPTNTNFQACRQKWLDVREIYGLTETFRFAEGPIDNVADGPEGLINAWPMDEAYVDYVQGNVNSGIINDVVNFPVINMTTLINANENGGEENISLGFHAIEFLLWGQDLSTSSSGNRPYTDYLSTGGTATNQTRRGEYLNTTIEILVAGLKQVSDAWDPNITLNSYRIEFLSIENNLAIRKMFNSLRVLSGFELSGERMYTAYSNMDQEDEHSCFSDNTHRDIYLNAKGMQNLYNGTYTRTNLAVVSGYALKDLVALYNSDQNTDIINYLSSSITKINAMYIPFDQAIILTNERPKVLDAVTELQVLETKIITAANSLGIHF